MIPSRKAAIRIYIGRTNPGIVMNIRLLQAASLAFALLAPLGCLFSSGGGGGKKLPANVPRGYFAFSQPAPFAHLSMDSSYTVAWTSSDSSGSGPVRLSLYKGQAFVANLSTSLTNSGTYTWSLSATRSASGYRFGSGGEYRLRLANAADSAKWDFGDWFTVGSRWSGYIGLTSPSAGARARVDSALTIAWETTGEPGPLLGLQLYRDTALATSISNIVPDNGSYTWSRVATSLGSGDDYRIRIFSVGDPAIATFSPRFSIASNYSGGYAFKAPKAGDTLAIGNSAKATWTVTGSPGVSAEISLWRDSVKLATVAYPSSATVDSINWSVPAGLTTSDRYRLRIASASDAGLFAWSAYFTIKGADPDAFENDDSLSLSKPIDTDGKAQARSLTLRDTDWLRFAAKPDKRYLISLKAGVTMYVQATDTAGRLLKEQSGSNVQIILAPAYAGNHHVRVYPYSTSASALGPYQIAVTEYDSTGSPFDARFSSPDGKTTWAAGSRYTLTWTPDSLVFGSLVSLALYNDTTLTATLATALSNSGTYDWSIPAGTYTGQKYRIRMMAYSNSQVYAFSPAFSISGATPDAYEPDNSRPAAKPIAADGKAQQHTLNSGDQDWMRFEATKGRRYVASVIGTGGASLYAYILDSAGSQVAYLAGQKVHVPVVPAYTGYYYVRVNDAGGTGEYAVSLAAYDSTANGYPARFTVPDSAATWAAGTAYTVNWIPDTALFGTTVGLALWMDDRAVQTISSSVTNAGTYSWTLNANLATGSRYRLRMTGTTVASVPAATGFGPRFSISGLAPDAFEPDADKASAKPILADGAAQQRNAALGDTDWVRLEVSTAKTYIVSVNSVSASFLLAAQDSAGAALASQSGAKFAVSFTPAKDGIAYLRINPYSGYGAYQLSVYAQTAGQDGVPAKFTAPDTGTAWSAGSSYTATWSPDSAIYGSTIGLALLKGTTLISTLVSSQSNSGTAQVFLPTGLATGNDYRLRLISGNSALLYGHSAAFSIAGIPADGFEPNDSSAAAKAWVPNAARQTLSLSYRDKDWYKFAAQAQMLYLVQAASAATLHTTLRIWPATGTSALLTGTKTGTDTLNSLAWVAPSTGNFPVSVEAVSTSAYGNYGFEIKEIDPGSYKFAVSAPAAGASIKAGDAVAVQWSDPAGIKGQVDIFLYNAEGVVQTVIAGVANSGTYTWTVPAGLPGRSDYYVKVISRLNSGISGSGGAFTLAP